MAFEAEALKAAAWTSRRCRRATARRTSRTSGRRLLGRLLRLHVEEVLDADTVEWFKENGGLTRENGDRFRETLLSRGGSKDAMQLFRDFTGHEP